MTSVTLRAAKRSDAADLTILDNIAGHGISAWFWQGAVMMGKAEDAYDWGRSRLAADDAIYGWSNSVVAERGEILGAACSYQMPSEDEPDEAKNPPQFQPVFELFECAIGDWLVDSLAVYKLARGQGIGAMLLDDCFRKALEAGVSRISLVAEDSNTSALALYRSRGFITREQRPYIPFQKATDTQNWLLLSTELT